MIQIILTTILLFLFYYKAVRPLSYWKNKGIPYKKPWPLVGNTIDVVLQRKSFFDYVLDLYREFAKERFYGSHQFIKPVLFVNDLDLIKKITVKDHDLFIDHNNISTEEVEPLMEKSLFNLKGQRWRDMRATLSPSFTSSKMKMMFVLISECAEEFANYFEKKNNDTIEVEMKDIFSRFTNDAIATSAFGFKCNSLEERNNEFYLMSKRATTFRGISFLAFLVHNIFPQMAQLLKIRLLPNSVTTFFKRIVKETVTLREREGIIRPDMIHLLMDARKEERSNVVATNSERKHKIELSDDDVAAQALIFIFGGFETSSTLMSFIAYELAVNLDVQKKLQEEIDETSRECNGKLTYEAVVKMKYMDMVVSETLRKWPPGFFIDRVCTKDYRIEPINPWEKLLIIEKGTVVQIPVIGLHRDPKYFPNPESFDPERFNDINKHTIESFSYLPFGSGPRSCIASRFALMENKALIYHLLSKFDIVRTNKTPYPMKIAPNTFNLGPSEGFWLGLRKRIPL